MKLFGKKTLSLVMAIAMVLSVCSVNVFAANEPEEFNVEYSREYTGRAYYDEIDLKALLEDELSEYYGENVVLDNMSLVPDENDQILLDYGTVDRYNVYSIDLTAEAYDDLLETGHLYENRIYYEAYEGWYDYEGYIEITITGYDNDLEYDLEGETEFWLGEHLANDLTELMTETLDYVEFELDRDNDCGDLYIYDTYYDNWEEFDDNQKYYYKPNYNDDYDLEDIYFEPDGTEGEFIIYYYAYGMGNERIEGIITLICGEGLIIEADITSDEVYTFDSDVFQDAVDEWNDSYTLVYIDNVKLNDATAGTLYYAYEEGSRRNVEIDGREEYYVDSKANDLLDEITFVPASRTKGTVVVSFTALVEKSNGRNDETLTGVLKIAVDQAADITVKAGAGQTVEIDYEVFEEYLDATLESNWYDVAYVTISGAPRDKENGYLVTDDENLTSRGDKSFYMDPTARQYALKDLNYKGGTKKATHSATFTVYYYKTSTSKTPTAAPVGTMDFVVGSVFSNNISTKTPLKASQTMSFAAELSAFQSLGGNDNEYIEFVTLPLHGTLYYNYGTASQQKVSIGEEYYIAYQAGELLLSNVTYVPSYSSSKVAKTDIISVKGYDDDGDDIKGTVNIGLVYSYYSPTFTDVKDSKYADSVEFLVARGITNGLSATAFGPNEGVTRGQFVTFLYRAAGSPVVDAATKAGNKFTDVKSNDYYYNAVLWAVKNGITNGTGATTFSPNAPVTHEQLVTFLYRYDVLYMKNPGTLGSSYSITDYNKVSSYAQNPVLWAVGKQVLDAGALNPAAAGTRATVALWLHRMLTL